ncbi:MAG: alpha/beta fold hydrolase [Myxococcaceae bacterium]|nr:alpha/beta fold hydrolase [Myxococcaceae bacterium]
MPTPAQVWFPFVKRSAAARARLFCLPHSGGGASYFRPWQAHFGARVEVWAAQPPGRESRFREPAFESYVPYVASLLEAMRPHLDLPFAVFGHSLGGGVAFELCRALRANGLRQPEHLFVSAHAAPELRPADMHLADLAEPEFVAAIREMGGTPPEVFEHPELLQMLVGVLRSDYRLFASYQYTPEAPLTVPITAVGGEADRSVTRQDLEAWRPHSERFTGARLFTGGHFFLAEHRAALLQMIEQSLGVAPSA